MKFIKYFRLNEATLYDVEGIFDRLCNYYDLELIVKGEHKMIIFGEFKKDPIVPDNKLIFLLNTTNKKLDIDRDIVAICKISYLNKKPIIGLRQKTNTMIGTFTRIISLLKSKGDIYINEICIEIII